MLGLRFCNLSALLLFSLVSASVVQGADYWPKKTCTPGTEEADCGKTTTGLRCSVDQCQCEETPYAFKFAFGSVGKCVLPEGAQCTANPPPEDRITPGAACVANEPVKCKEGYEAFGGKCLKTSGCTENKDCNEDDFLSCEVDPASPSNRICACADGSVLGLDKKCQLKINWKCTKENPLYPDKKCRSLAQCKNVAESGQPEDLKCACNDGLAENLKGECKVLHDGDCTTGADKPCDQFQDCVTKEAGPPEKKICRCTGEGATTWYNDVKKVCEVLMTSPCDPAKTPCAEHAECTEVEGVPKCNCKGDLVPSADKKTCFGAKEAVCNNADPSKPKCSTEAFLECDKTTGEGKCVCMNAENSWYDEASKKCLLKATRLCELGEGKQSCVANSECKELIGGTNICQCKNNMVADSNGLCKVAYDGDCSNVETSPCDGEKFLECQAVGSDHKCRCQGEGVTTWYNDAKKVCEVLMTSPCDPAKIPCAEHAECTEVEGVPKCNCKGDLVPSANKKTCFGVKEAVCNNADPSKPKCSAEAFLECDKTTGEGKCVCMNAENSWYDEASKKCLLKANQPCELGGDKQPCVANSECKDDGGNIKCQCNNNMVADSNGLCKVAYDGDCSNVETSPCDGEKFLECQAVGSDQKCRCQGEGVTTWYNKNKNVCEALIGGTCGKNAPDCAEIKFGSCFENKCKCNEDLIPSLDKKACFLAKDAPCKNDDSTKAKCYGAGFQKCSKETGDGTCECLNKDNAWYDNASNKCSLLANKECELGEEKQSCVANAECKTTEGKNTCQCQNSMVADTNGFCKVAYNGDCSKVDSPCDSDKFLECQTEGSAKKCKCKGEGVTTWFNTEKQVCETLIGGTCKAGEPSCTELTHGECTNVGGTLKCQCKVNLIPSLDKKACFLAKDAPCKNDDSTKAKCYEAGFQKCSKETGDGTCECLNKDNAWYDEASKKCLLKANQPCELGGEKQPCVANSACKDDNGSIKCQCNNNMVADSNGLCKVAYDGDCSNVETSPCDGEKFLECQAVGSDRKCRCQGEGVTTWFNTEKKVCETLIGGTCKAGEPSCTELTHGECKNVGGTLKCQCKDNLIPSLNKHTCYSAKQAKCNNGDNTLPKCNSDEFQGCSVSTGEGICDCLNKDDVWYDSVVKKCLLRANKLCEIGSGKQSCVANSECKTVSGNNICQCKDNMGVGSDGFCKVAYNGDCSKVDSPCDLDKFLECKTEGNAKKCKCKGEEATTWYNTGTKTCETLIGGTCKNGEPSCTELTQGLCKDVSGTLTCTCKDNLIPSSDKKTCYGLNKATCNEKDSKVAKCSPDAFLTCSSTTVAGTCECLDKANALYDENSKKCQRLVDASCKPGNGEQSCVANSQCEKTLCKCNDKYTGNKNKVCVGKHGTGCSLPGDCDTDNFLTCTSKSCACSDPKTMKYDDNDDKCYTTLNSACANDKPLCDPSMLECDKTKCACSKKLGFVLESNSCASENYGAFCDDKDGIKCSTNAHLTCKEGACGCASQYMNVSSETTKPCVGSLGAQCKDKNDCNVAQLLECNTESGKCQCPFGQEIDEETGKCGAITFTLSFAIALLAVVAHFVKDF